MFELHTAWGALALKIQSEHQETSSDWKRGAEILAQIVNLNQECHVGGLDHKRHMLVSTIRVAHIAGKQDLVKIAMDVLKNVRRHESRSC